MTGLKCPFCEDDILGSSLASRNSEDLKTEELRFLAVNAEKIQRKPIVHKPQASIHPFNKFMTSFAESNLSSWNDFITLDPCLGPCLQFWFTWYLVISHIPLAAVVE